MVSFVPWPLYPKERTPSTHWIGGCVGPRAGPDIVEKRKIPCPYQESNPSHPARSLSLCWKLSWLLLKEAGVIRYVWWELEEVVCVMLCSCKYRCAINVNAKYNTEVNLISCWDLWNSLVRHISYGRSRESAVNIVTGYRCDCWRVRVQVLHVIQTSSGAYPAS
jgi:hypothetical protein